MFRPRDPKRGCVPSDPSIGSLRYGRDYGYQYNVPVSNEDDQSRRGFSPVDFVKEMLTGAVTGGMAGAAFYGAGRAVSALKESIKSESNSINRSRTPEEAGISVFDARRIQNAATRTNQDVVVVGSRANGTATPTSDWDYYMTGKSSQRHSATSSLPRGTSGGEINYLGGDSGIDIFVGYPNSPNYEPLITDKPHVIFKP
jgi:hypothetical protein